ncbi:MAG TPA: hypothetical protein VMH28_18930 [Candidatus Acidoferrales bacterium]|nr:hypothetical protein [Candidatus Acidoferrales bacterium]
MQLGDMPELEASGELAAEVAAGVREGGKCLILRVFIAADGDPHASVPGIVADVDFGYLDTDQARVVEFEADELGELLAEGFGDA